MDSSAMRVLLVEDNPGDAELIMDQLMEKSPSGSSVVWAASLKDACSVLSKDEIDVTIADLCLPDSRGLDTLSALRASGPNSAIVVLTGMDDEAVGLQAVRNGAADFLTKSGASATSLARAAAYARERRRLQRLQDALHRARKLEAVGRLSFGIAHHYNNLLAIIMGHTFMLSKRLAPDAAERAHVAAIEDAAERARVLTRQLIQFCGRNQTEPAALDVNELLEGCVGTLRETVGPQMEIALEPSSAAGRGFADRTGLEQSLLILVLNARDAMRKQGRITISTGRVELGENIGARASGEARSFVTISVADEGCGMDETRRDRAFEPFFTTKEIGEATGMGLAVVHGVFQQVGGFVHLTPRDSGGTTVTIHLRAAEEA